jgi:hypothetical protein
MAYPLLLNPCVARRISSAVEILMPLDCDDEGVDSQPLVDVECAQGKETQCI